MFNHERLQIILHYIRNNMKRYRLSQKVHDYIYQIFIYKDWKNYFFINYACNTPIKLYYHVLFWLFLVKTRCISHVPFLEMKAFFPVWESVVTPSCSLYLVFYCFILKCYFNIFRYFCTFCNIYMCCIWLSMYIIHSIYTLLGI